MDQRHGPCAGAQRKEPDHVYSLKGPAVSYAGCPSTGPSARSLSDLKAFTSQRDVEAGPARVVAARIATFTLRLFVVQFPCFCFLVWFERYLRSGHHSTSRFVFRQSPRRARHQLYRLRAGIRKPRARSRLRIPRVRAHRDRTPSHCQHRSMVRAFWVGVLLRSRERCWSILRSPSRHCSGRVGPLRLLSADAPRLFALGGMLNAAALDVLSVALFRIAPDPDTSWSTPRRIKPCTSKGLFGSSRPTWEPFKRLSIDPGFGFFGTSPYMWLGLLAVPFALVFTFGPPRVRRIRRRATFVWIVAMLSIWLAVSGAVNWRAGWTIGPRYLGAAPPFFAFGAVCALEKIAHTSPFRRALARGLAGGLAMASVAAIGFVSIVYNTLPPTLLASARSVSRCHSPAPGLSAHHVQWSGWAGTRSRSGTSQPQRSLARPSWQSSRGATAHAWSYAAQLGVAALACSAGLRPQFAPPKPGEPLERFDLRGFVDVWEPHGRDRLASLRVEAERYGPRRPMSVVSARRPRGVRGTLHGCSRDVKRSEAPRSTCHEAPGVSF
jgi:hypothetical protein